MPHLSRNGFVDVIAPGLTGQIKREIHHQDFLLKKARKSKLDEDRLAYQTMRNRVSNIVRRAKQTYMYNKKLIKDHQDDSKTFWKTMYKILPGEKKSSVIENIQVDGKLCTNNKKISNAFNMFFASAVTHLRQSLDLGSNARKFTHVVNHSLTDFQV